MKLGALMAATLVVVVLSAPFAARADTGNRNACQGEGIGREPLVQSEATAKEIFLAIARARAPFNMKRYPLVVANDAGDHWEVTQAGKTPSTTYAAGTVTTTFGGGQLSMHIDKCSGAISKAYFSK